MAVIENIMMQYIETKQINKQKKAHEYKNNNKYIQTDQLDTNSKNVERHLN